MIDWDVLSRDRARSEVLAAVAPRRDVSRQIETLREAACDPRIVECEGIVLANLGAAFDLPDPAVLVDIGHAKTTFCALVSGRAVGSHAIRTAGLALTQALAEDRGLDLDAAEQTKCEEGVLDPSVGTPHPKVARVLDRISSELLRLVSSLEPVMGDALPTLVLMGGSAQLDRIDTLIEERTQLATQRLGLPREETGIALVAGGSPIVYAPTIALALRGTPRARTSFNFRRDEFSKPIDLSRYRRDFGTTGLLAVAVALLAILSFTSSTWLQAQRASEIETQIAALHEQALPGKPLPDNALASLRTAIEDAKDRANFLGVYRGNLSALDVLVEMSLRVPAEVDVTFQELSIDRQTVRIRVFAPSPSRPRNGWVEAAEAKFGPFANSRIGDITTRQEDAAERSST